MSDTLAETALDLMFRQARTHGEWQDRPLPLGIPKELYELAKWGPTSMNSGPARFVFLTSEAAKQRLQPHLDPGNVAKTMSAPCCVIVAYDRQFSAKLEALLPAPMGAMAGAFFGANPEMAEESAIRNSTLQGAYLIMAARGLGLDCGPMQGFNRAGVDAEFFPGENWTANFLVNLGYGEAEKVRPRNPRLPFEEACKVL